MCREIRRDNRLGSELAATSFLRGAVPRGTERRAPGERTASHSPRVPLPRSRPQLQLLVSDANSDGVLSRLSGKSLCSSGRVPGAGDCRKAERPGSIEVFLPHEIPSPDRAQLCSPGFHKQRHFPPQGLGPPSFLQAVDHEIKVAAAHFLSYPQGERLLVPWAAI